MLVPPTAIKMDCSELNSPVQTLYRADQECVYCFFRHGEVFCFNVRNKECHLVSSHNILEKNQSLDNVYLVYNKIFLVNTCNKVIFFKEEQSKEYMGSAVIKLKEYHHLEHCGEIHFIKGNDTIQMTSKEIIYFYKMDEQTLLPRLTSCMYNFFNCTVFMFGSENRYCVTYKVSEVGFQIYRRKYHHSFVADLHAEAFDESKSINLHLWCCFVVSNHN